MKCHVCREKEAELLTWWERTRYWLFVKVNSALFTQDYDDLKNDKYTQGFSDGFIDGTEKEKSTFARYQELYNVKQDPVDIESMVESRLLGMLSPIDPNKVVSFNEKTKQIYIGGILAEDNQLRNLKQEADAFMSFGLWDLLYHSIKSLAEKAMFIEGDSLDTMKKGRIMLYTLSTQKKILDTLRSVR